jgi:ribose transport system ATP-binding protein
MGSRVPSWRPDIAVRAGAGFLAADRKALGGIMTFSATENLTLSDLSAFWHGLRLSTREERTECNDWFERLDIRPKGAEGAALSTFSGGNQQKVLLAKWLRCAQPVLLLDDPTQGVDVGAKTEIHDLILRASADGAAIVVSSSDLDELATVCDRVLVMYRGEVAAELTGSDVAPGKIDAAMLTGARPMGAAL